MTEEGVSLGRFLFFDPILSLDSTVSCASCHQPALAFADEGPLSQGVNGLLGKRNAPSLTNVAFVEKGLFWDGRAKSLEEQSLHPIQDPLEMNADLETVLERLRQHPDYPRWFREAFGINDRTELEPTHLALALAQFERTLLSFESKYDYANWDRGPETRFFSASELRGKNLFNIEPIDPSVPHPGCGHCHNGPLVTTDEFLNNGLDPADEWTDFPDPGLGAITLKASDYGKFRTPTLRNLAFTGPYMHDGRFQTLEEVLDHYSSGGHYADNLDANILPFPLSTQDKADLIAFLLSMTDSSFVLNPAFQNPWIE